MKIQERTNKQLKKKNHDKKQSIKPIKKTSGKPAPNLTCQKAKHQEYPDVKLVFEKWRYNTNPMP